MAQKYYTHREADAEASRRFKKNGGAHVVMEVERPSFFVRSFKSKKAADKFVQASIAYWRSTTYPDDEDEKDPTK